MIKSELVQLYAALERLDLTFDDMAYAVMSIFSSTLTSLDLGALLSILLRERVLLPKSSMRVSALFCISRLFTGSIRDNPFADVILEYYENDLHKVSADLLTQNPIHPIPRHVRDQIAVGPSISAAEKWMACCIVSGEKYAEVSRMDVGVVIDMVTADMLVKTLRLPHVIQSSMNFREHIHYIRGFKSCIHTPAIITMPESDDLNYSEPTVHESLAAAVDIFVSSEIAISELYELPVIEVPINERTKDDSFSGDACIWLFPPCPGYDFDIDTSTSQDVRSQDIARRVMAIAHQRPLNNPQMKLAINELERTATFCLLLDYSPVKISELIENNPAVAVVLIRQLIASSHEDICLSAVISSPVTLHSMEVFNGLLSTLELPNEFITAYISNCIQSCDRIRDRLSQSRQVRLVCVFLQSVFRNPALSMHQFQIEIESFCIQYSWVKEATIVFQSLKRG